MHHDQNVTATVGHLIDGQLVADTKRTPARVQPRHRPVDHQRGAGDKATGGGGIASAEAAFPPWRATPPLARVAS